MNKEAVMIPVAKIDVPEKYIRENDSYRTIEDRLLRESIKTVGLRFPIIVKERDKRYVLVDGVRRLKAVKSLSYEDIRAFVIPESETFDLDALRWQYNVQREDLKPMDEAEIIRSLVVDESMGILEVAKALGMKPASVRRYLYCLEIGDQWKKLVNRGAMPIGAARFVAALSPLGQRELYRKMADREIPFSYDNVEAMVRTLDPVKNPEFFNRPKQVASTRIDDPTRTRIPRNRLESVANQRAMIEHYKEQADKMQREVTVATPVIKKIMEVKELFEILPERTQAFFVEFVRES